MSKKIAVIGTGPAGLMTAYELARQQYQVSIFEKRKGPGRKLLIAGSSGLNISSALPPEDIPRSYLPADKLAPHLESFSVQAWLDFIHHLGLKTFKGTSQRYFVEEMTAAGLLNQWIDSLKSLGVQFFFQHEFVNFEIRTPKKVTLEFLNPETVEIEFDAVCLCLGGGSWEPTEIPLRWPAVFQQKALGFSEFVASNVGFKVNWPQAFLKEAEGKPIKNINLHSPRGSRSGDLMVTSYGLEGTPIYSVGLEGMVSIDLKPDLSKEQIRKKLSAVRENLSPLRRVGRNLNLCEAAMALLFHLGPKNVSLDDMIELIKDFPIELQDRQPLAEAISSSGGVQWSELDANLMLKKFPGVFVAGEMIDWDAPTGGFLIQGSASLGHAAAVAIIKYCHLD